MIVDVFEYHNEIEMLKARAYELDGLVDMHVAVEGNMTKSGRPRKYALKGDEIPNLRVVQVDLTDVSDVTLDYDINKTIQRPGYTPSVYKYADNWKRDRKQREGVGLTISALPDDAIILYGDVDEIPRRSVVEAFDSPVVGLLRQECLIYDLQWTGGQIWEGTTIGTKAAYGDASFAQVREVRAQKYPHIVDAGWHLTWFGGRRAVLAKVKVNAHGEMAEDLDVLTEQYDKHIWPGGTIQLWKYGGDVPRYVEDGLQPAVWDDREAKK